MQKYYVFSLASSIVNPDKWKIPSYLQQEIMQPFIIQELRYKRQRIEFDHIFHCGETSK